MPAEPMDSPSEDEQVDNSAISTERSDNVSRTNLKAQRQEKLRRMMDEDGNLVSSPRSRVARPADY